MKYYEIRKKKNKVHVILEYISKKVLPCLETDFDILPYLAEDENGYYKVEFRAMCDSITKDKLAKAGFTNTDKRFDWILNDSDHRKDVRVVTEDKLNEILDGSVKEKVCKKCDSIFEEYDEIPKTKILATKAIHKMGDISRDEPDDATVYYEDEDNYYGEWDEGYGFIMVQFPKETSKVID